MTEKAQKFVDMHAGPGAFVIPNPYDAGTAKLLARKGFRALATSSAAAAFALGRQDGAWQVSRAEMLDHARQIVEATDLPVSADLEAGFGDLPEVVGETIAEAIAIGCAGGSIEDSTGVEDRPLYDLDIATERIRAARDAIDDVGRPFVLTARSETFLVGHPEPLEEGIRRIRAYAAAGADCVYIPGLSRPDDISQVVEATGVPVNVLAGFGKAPLTVAELADLGVRRISLGSHLVRAALGAFLAAADEIAADGSFAFCRDAEPFATFDAAFAPPEAG